MRTIESGRGAPGAADGLGAGRIRGTNPRGRNLHLGVTADACRAVIAESETGSDGRALDR